MNGPPMSTSGGQGNNNPMKGQGKGAGQMKTVRYKSEPDPSDSSDSSDSDDYGPPESSLSSGPPGHTLHSMNSLPPSLDYGGPKGSSQKGAGKRGKGLYGPPPMSGMQNPNINMN